MNSPLLQHINENIEAIEEGSSHKSLSSIPKKLTPEIISKYGDGSKDWIHLYFNIRGLSFELYYTTFKQASEDLLNLYNTNPSLAKFLEWVSKSFDIIIKDLYDHSSYYIDDMDFNTFKQHFSKRSNLIIDPSGLESGHEFGIELETTVYPAASSVEFTYKVSSNGKPKFEKIDGLS